MTTPVRLTIKGSDVSGTDAPTVDDMVGQLQDLVEVLRGVEKAVADDGANALVWRVTNASMNSPLSIEITAFSANPAIFADSRAQTVTEATRKGLTQLAEGVARPTNFTDDVLPSAIKLQKRVLNGLSETEIDFKAGIRGGEVLITPQSARVVTDAANAARPVKHPYREMGSIEGFIASAERDGHGRGILHFRRRLDGQILKAVATGEAFSQLEELRLGEVWEGLRVRVHGLINYRDLGVVDNVNATWIEPLDRHPLPGPEDIVDPNFTGGLQTEEFLEQLRHG